MSFDIDYLLDPLGTDVVRRFVTPALAAPEPSALLLFGVAVVTLLGRQRAKAGTPGGACLFHR